MSRYIDAEKVMEEINRIGGHNLCEWDTIGVKALIDRQSTADVVEVRHGEWIKLSAHSDACCSRCQRPPKILFGILPLYCPNCGAKMDGERKD